MTIHLALGQNKSVHGGLKKKYVHDKLKILK